MFDFHKAKQDKKNQEAAKDAADRDIQSDIDARLNELERAASAHFVTFGGVYTVKSRGNSVYISAGSLGTVEVLVLPAGKFQITKTGGISGANGKDSVTLNDSNLVARNIIDLFED